ncbi:MAG TPA: hypothetical protein VGQ51_18635 [Puia sp.]|nr:hypothetical protein [Puia sp.]
MQYSRDKNLLLTVFFLFWLPVVLFFALDHRLLSQVRPALFWFNRDLAELTLIGIGLPRWMIDHPASFAAMDGLAVLLPIILLRSAIRNKRFSSALGWIFTVFLVLYILLADIFWQVHLEPFVIYWLLSLAFLTNSERRFYGILRICRYYFLYIFVSAAIWKIARGAVFNGQEMSDILLRHQGYLLAGDCDTWTCRFCSWLIDHPGPAQTLYIAAAVLEAFFLIGFFTRRYDRLLIALAVLFVVADLVVMRIPYWTLLVGTVTLWIGSDVRRPAIVIYETTHHENLPALLDLCETRFPRVIVFLKESSWQNLSGGQSPSDRWPRTEFIRQPAGSRNRPFIRSLFSFIRRHHCSHLHLSTLDNNLLVFALRIAMAGNVHISLTVHEVNAWFRDSFRSVRKLSESLAKRFLRRRVRHYTVFLPAIADHFRQRMPDAVTVFIPSRFYMGPSPRGAALPLTIVVPGSVEANRRDYESVAAFFETWRPARPVRLILLGDSDSPYGSAIVARFARLESSEFLFTSYKGYIPERLYEQKLREADLIWSPLRVHKTGGHDEPETYGLTTASGLTADLLLNNIPALVPAEFGLPEPFRKALLPYSSMEDIARLIDIGRQAGLRGDIDKAFVFFRKENFFDAFDRLTSPDYPGQKG